MGNYKNLSERLRYALKTLEVSQSELAKRLSIKPQMIQYLCASNSVKSKFTFDIAEALEIDVSWLATGKGNPPTLFNKSEVVKNKIPLLTYNQIRDWKIYKKLNKPFTSSWIPVCDDINLDSYALVLNDRSMAPRFDLDTIIIIDPTVTVNDEIKNNLYVLIYLANEDFVVFRHLVCINNNRYLMPINTRLYKEIILNEQDIILGVCKEARWNG